MTQIFKIKKAANKYVNWLSTNNYEEIKEIQLFPILDYIHRLPLREQRVIDFYYLQDKTYDEIAYLLDVHRERVRQIKDLAMHKLRHMLQHKYRFIF